MDPRSRSDGHNALHVPCIVSAFADAVLTSSLRRIHSMGPRSRSDGPATPSRYSQSGPLRRGDHSGRGESEARPLKRRKPWTSMDGDFVRRKLPTVRTFHFLVLCFPLLLLFFLLPVILFLVIVLRWMPHS